jgi:hypothetical protein
MLDVLLKPYPTTFELIAKILHGVPAGGGADAIKAMCKWTIANARRTTKLMLCWIHTSIPGTIERQWKTF